MAARPSDRGTVGDVAINAATNEAIDADTARTEVQTMDRRKM